MLRLLGMTGIIVFAVLIGISSNSLRRMYESGELMDRYNSDRKADITLLVFSSAGIAALGYFEVRRIRLLQGRVSYGRSRYNENKSESAVKDTSNIYSAPKTQDAWKGRRTKSANFNTSSSSDTSAFWIGLLNVLSFAMPLLYSVLLIYQLFFTTTAQSETAWMLPALFIVLLVISILMAIGIRGRKIWGLNLGYLLAICNMPVFPFGTATGLFLLVGLVGASSVFHVSDRGKSSKARRKASLMT